MKARDRERGIIRSKTAEMGMTRTRVHKFALLQLITILCRITNGELTVVRPHKALMIPQEELNQISNHVFDNGIGGIVRYSCPPLQ